MKSPSILLSIVAAVTMVQTGAMAEDLTVKFDTQFLGTFPTPPTGHYGVWSPGSLVSEDHIFVSFQWSGSGSFTAIIPSSPPFVGGKLVQSQTQFFWTFTPTTGSSKTTNSIMSPSFTVAQLNGPSGNGFKIEEAHGQNIYIEYGQDTISGYTPPGPTFTSRYTDIEFSYDPKPPQSNFNNADLTGINNIGAALNLRYDVGTTHRSIGFPSFTSTILPKLVSLLVPFGTTTDYSNAVLSSQTSSGNLEWGGNGSCPYVAAVQGSVNLAKETGFYSLYPAAIDAAISGNLFTPLLTNCAGGVSPTPTNLVESASFMGKIASQQKTHQQYEVSYAFLPSFASSTDNTYAITFTGTITAVTKDYINNHPPGNKKTYGSTTPLKIKVSASDSFWGYLKNGDVNDSVVTLEGADWTSFSTDFYNNGTNYPLDGSLGSQGAPKGDIAGGTTTSNDSSVYGQIVQNVLGDFQELAMIGCFGNTKMGIGKFSTTKIGAIPSWDIFQDKSYAYNFQLTQIPSPAYNVMGRYLWENTTNIDNGTTSIGAMYSNNYDDRFGKGGVSLKIDTGGTLTVQLKEIAPTPVGCPDGIIDGAALAIFLANWGSSTYPCGDFDQDGSIGGGDLSMLLARWGTAW